MPPGTTASIKQNTRTMSRAAIKVVRPLMPNSHSLFSFTFFIRVGTSAHFLFEFISHETGGLDEQYQDHDDETNGILIAVEINPAVRFSAMPRRMPPTSDPVMLPMPPRIAQDQPFRPASAPMVGLMA